VLNTHELRKLFLESLDSRPEDVLGRGGDFVEGAVDFLRG
jgi:hypothetical protein